MIRLCGFAASNYYNKVKLALIEKGVPFEEQLVYPSQEEELLADSPMGKVPFLKLAQGTLAESQAISEYLEDRYPEHAAVSDRAVRAGQGARADRGHRTAPGAAGATAVRRGVLRRQGERRHQEGGGSAPAQGLAGVRAAGAVLPLHRGRELHATRTARPSSTCRWSSASPRSSTGPTCWRRWCPTAAPYLKAMGERPASKTVNEARKAEPGSIYLARAAGPLRAESRGRRFAPA